MHKKIKKWAKSKDFWKTSDEEFVEIFKKYEGKKLDENVFVEIADYITCIVANEYGL